ncbi:glycosyltransferase family 4 protein [Kaistella sp. DKR-2]|uniref:glycosyltransferase family 4 protein n=1 Tax=Kaistella soli TaxID=2849654 RepID=UPI001C270444|nr:glycosyltransferase family 4 protein [Kaistella soli]MBU8883092.1 glycosyltransferase family 4 protein [Kaistella soli]
MKKLLYITNIPAPYRQKRYNSMAKIFPKYGIEFEVLYMAKSEPDRQWVIPNDSYQYPHTFYKGIHPVIGNFFAHFNPGLLFRLLKNDYDIAVVAGMSSPTHWLAPFFIRGDKKQIMSVESNLYSTERTTGLGAKIKRILLSKASAYQTTGTPQIEYITFFQPAAKMKPFIKMPNLIDEEVFVQQVRTLRKDKHSLREKFGMDDMTQMWVLPARFVKLKGIIPFISLLEGVKNIKLFLLGDGELSGEIMDVIAKRQLPVVKVGFVQQESLIAYYAAADLFVFPSLKDASPLSPIEACAAGLPLLVSSRIGNLEDVVQYAANGWYYDPIDEKEKGKELIEILSTMQRSTLSEYGDRSYTRYEKKFNTDRCIHEYAKQLSDFIGN